MLPLGRFLSIKKIYVCSYVCVCFIHTHDRVQQDAERDKSDISGTLEGGLGLEEGL